MRIGLTCFVILCASVAVVGCSIRISGSPTSSNSAAPAGTSTGSQPLPQFTPSVAEPKDARGIAACDLLTEAQLIELGLRPETAEPGGSASVPTCGWRSNDPGNPAGVQLNTALDIPVLDGLYLVRDTFAVYEPIEIGGHPAVHADRNAGPVCTVYTAISDYQGVATDGNLGGRPLADPCAPSRRMAELILSNLPPLR